MFICKEDTILLRKVCVISLFQIYENYKQKYRINSPWRWHTLSSGGGEFVSLRDESVIEPKTLPLVMVILVILRVKSINVEPF